MDSLKVRAGPDLRVLLNEADFITFRGPIFQIVSILGHILPNSMR